MQKLGRANRSRIVIGDSVFIWLPESKVRGPRWGDLDAVEQERLLNRKRKPRARLPGELEPVHVSELLPDASAVTTAQQKVTKSKLRKNAPPELWGQEVLSLRDITNTRMTARGIPAVNRLKRKRDNGDNGEEST